MTEPTPIQRACDIAGGQSALARLLINPRTKKPLTPQAVQYWCRDDNVVPAEWVLPIEAATENQVTRYELRPDLYPRTAAA